MSILSCYIDFWRQYVRQSSKRLNDVKNLLCSNKCVWLLDTWLQLRSLHRTQHELLTFMKARAKRVHILMINANKTFFFFRSQNLLKIEWMISRTLILSKLLITRTKTIILSPISPTLRFFQRIFVSLEGSKNQDSTVAVYLHNVTQCWEEHFVTVQITAV